MNQPAALPPVVRFSLWVEDECAKNLATMFIVGYNVWYHVTSAALNALDPCIMLAQPIDPGGAEEQ